MRRRDDILPVLGMLCVIALPLFVSACNQGEPGAIDTPPVYQSDLHDRPADPLEMAFDIREEREAWKHRTYAVRLWPADAAMPGETVWMDGDRLIRNIEAGVPLTIVGVEGE